MRIARRSAACGKNDYLKLPNPQIQLYLAFYLPGEGEGGSGKGGEEDIEGMDMENRAL
jgi:hypothetical protein